MAASTPVEIFCSYAHEDEPWLRKLEIHVSLLKQQGLISLWHDRLIVPGTNWAKVIDTHLEMASVILLLVSGDFFASNYCYGIEMKRALERAQVGEALVVPILVRPADWTDAPFAHLQILPTDAKPLSTWSDEEAALTNVAMGIRHAIEELPKLSASAPRAVLPPIWNIPYPRNPFFMGREDLLLHLHTQLQRGQPMALSQHPQAISGLGGIGKTQITVEYAYQYAHDYQAILWVRADTHEALVSGYVALARLLNLPQKDEDDQTIIVQAVVQWLKTHQEWLLILDNADDLDIVSKFLRFPLGGHVLLTTRAHAVGSLAQRVEVGTMSQEAGALLLLRRAHLIERDAGLEATSPTERVAACAIADELGGLPLALDQAGAYLEETRCSLISYQQVLQQHRMQLLGRRGSFPQDYPFSVATTWVLSFEQIKQQNPAAADMLSCCAFLHPDAIPEELFTVGAHHLGPTLKQVGCSAFAFNEAIKVLLAYSLIHRDPRAATLSIHRLVQAVLLNAMPEEHQSRWRECVVQALNEAFPENVLQAWMQCGRLLPHVQVCTSWGEHELRPSPQASSLFDKAGAYLLERGQFQEAEPLLKRALTIREQQFGAKHPSIIKSLNNLAQLSYRLFQYEQIEPFAKRALAICEQSLGNEHPETAMSLHNLASAYLMQGKYKQGESLLKQALTIREQKLGTEHPETARSLTSLGFAYGRQGKYRQAEASHLRAISIYEQQLGIEHRHTALFGWCCLAELYRAQGKYEKAKHLLEPALAVCEQILGTEHLETALCLGVLALVDLEQGQYEQAKYRFERILAIRDRHPEAVEQAEWPYFLYGLAKLAQHEEKYEQAKKWYLDALDLLEQREPMTTPLTKQDVQRDYALFLHLVEHDAEVTILETGHINGDH